MSTPQTPKPDPVPGYSREQEEFAQWDEERLARSVPDPEIDRLWADEVQRRLEEIRSGKVQTIPGEQVMADLRKHYSE